MGLHSRLAEKEHEKREYERDLSECKESYDFISQKRRIIEEDIYQPDKAFDMTSSGDWYGKLEQDADSFRNDLCSKTSILLSNTSEHLNDLQKVMERLRELIRECEEEIAALEEEIRERERRDNI